MNIRAANIFFWCSSLNVWDILLIRFEVRTMFKVRTDIGKTKTSTKSVEPSWTSEETEDHSGSTSTITTTESTTNTCSSSASGTLYLALFLAGACSSAYLLSYWYLAPDTDYYCLPPPDVDVSSKKSLKGTKNFQKYRLEDAITIDLVCIFDPS